MSLIVNPDQNSKPTKPQGDDRSELAMCIGHCDQLVKGPIDVLRTRITRLFEEGLDKQTVIAALLGRHHEKQEAKLLGEVAVDYLTLDDLTVVENQMGINKLTEENRAHWLEKFQSGRARYLCPECGYAGNGEFWHFPPSMGDLLSCYQCGHAAYSKYFTRMWTPAQQAQYETEQAARSAAFERQRQERTELEAKRKIFMESIRADALKALEQIDRHQWVELENEDIETYRFNPDPDEFDNMYGDSLDILSDLIILPLKDGSSLRYPWDEIVAFFKTNLQPSKEDKTSPLMEFSACAKKFQKMFQQVKEEYR